MLDLDSFLAELTASTTETDPRRAATEVFARDHDRPELLRFMASRAT